MSKKSIEVQMQSDNPEFVAEVAGLSTEEVNNRIAQLAKDVQSVNESKEADESLKALKDEVTQASAPYRESKKALGLKTQYLIKLLSDRGE